MNRLIPGKTKVQVELFRGVTIGDIVIAAFGIAMITLILMSSLPAKLWLCIGVVAVCAILLVRMDTTPTYQYLMGVIAHFAYKRRYKRLHDDAYLMERANNNGTQAMFDRMFTGEEGAKGGKKKLSKAEIREKRQAAKAEKLAKKKLSGASSDTDAKESPKDVKPARKTGKERAQERRAEKEKKREDAILKDPKTPQEVKDQILEARREKAKTLFLEGFDEAESTALAIVQKADAVASGEVKLSRKEEDKLLKSGKLTEEQREAIKERRRRESAEAMQKTALAKEKTISRESMKEIIGFTGITDGYIEYGKDYYGSVIEIDPVEFRFFSQHRRSNSIENCFGKILRSLHGKYAANIVKIERPINYDGYLAKERQKIDQLRRSFESGLLSEDEYQIRVEIAYDRLNEIEGLCTDDKVVEAFFYLVLFESDKKQLDMMVKDALVNLTQGELTVRQLEGPDLAVFLKYTNQIDFDEHEIEKIRPEDYAEWAKPNIVDIKARRVEINHIITHNFRVVSYPMVVGDAWLAGVMSMPGTKVVVKVTQMDREKAIRSIDRSLMELRGQWSATGVDSKRIEIESHLNTLQELLATLQGDNEVLLECNIYVTAYDITATRNNMTIPQPPPSLLPTIGNMKKTVRRGWQEAGFRLNNMEFSQMEAFLGSQISSLDPMVKDGRGIPSNTIAACFPWIFAHISDEGGIKLGESGGVPVFINFFRRDSERVNSNMVIVGKSGSGKSYATKSLLANLAAEDAKIFILDPENEYTELAENLHGKFINVGNAQFGRLNPFHIITAIDDDEEGEGGPSGSYATHLQFLEEFFKQILPDCDKDALEYLNNMVDRVYSDKGITPETDLSKLKPTDYPVFDDLYETIFEEFQSTDNQYLRTMLRTLMNYVAKFSTGGRNANIWNGPSTITTDENFTVFNFQSMLANRNTTIANAQMLLVLKYIDNEIIKNRDYNTRYGLNRKVVVVIDEAHVFIDTKFPVALDFMFQLAKRIRKYNGMQIVITQNIKDFVGSEEIARKSTAIINACQYSFIFALAPNDIQDLVKLYEKAGGINENEQEQITQAPRGQAFTIMGPNSRSTFMVDTPKAMSSMFENRGYESHYFASEEGQQAWEDYAAESRRIRSENVVERASAGELEYVYDDSASSGFMLEEVSGDSFDEGGLLFEEEGPAEEEFVFGEETPQKRGDALATLPPDAPAFGSGIAASAAQEALIGGIRELVDAVKGLSIDGLRTGDKIAASAAVPAAVIAEAAAAKPAEAAPESVTAQDDERFQQLYETINALRRQNEELRRSLEDAAAAPEEPETISKGSVFTKPGSTEPSLDDLAFINFTDEVPESEETDMDIPEFQWEEPEETEETEDTEDEDPWAKAWNELAAAGAIQDLLGEDAPKEAWDLDPVPPTEEDIAQQEALEAEAQDILSRSASLISNMTILERMAANGEEVMEITLDDLIAQIKSEERH